MVTESLNDAGYSERVKDCIELVEANEFGIALETICENLHDSECAISTEAYNLFLQVGTQINVKSHYWEVLNPQIC